MYTHICVCAHVPALFASSPPQVAAQQGAYAARLLNRGYSLGRGGLDAAPPLRLVGPVRVGHCICACMCVSMRCYAYPKTSVPTPLKPQYLPPPSPPTDHSSAAA